MKRAQLKTALFIAARYVFSKKKHNIINVMAIISTIGIAASAAALVIVLSVFNGLEELITDSFNSFNPDLNITLAEGKSFPTDSFPLADIAALAEVAHVDEVVSDMALVAYNDRQILATIKGVAPSYPQRSGIDSLLYDGSFALTNAPYERAVLGSIVAGTVDLRLNSTALLKCYYPKRTKKNLSNPADAFNTSYALPGGVFRSNTTYDEKVIFTSIAFARELMNYDGEATSVEVKLNDVRASERVQKEIQQLLGEKFVVKDRFQQEVLLFKTMKSEKLIIYVILSFILLVATFNIVGSLGMLIVEKKGDIRILQQLGAGRSFVRRLFLFEGLLISAIGGGVGVLVGAGVCWAQQTFHLISFDSGNMLVQYYPVAMRGTDFVIIVGTLFVIAVLASWLPARRIGSKM